MKKIDVFNHITPPRFSALTGVPGSRPGRYRQVNDMESRLKAMDECGLDMQVLSSLRYLDPPERCSTLNDCLAEFVEQRPDRFAAVATLPMTDPGSALLELDRAVKELHLKGVVVGSNINGGPLDAPEFIPLYEKMAGYGIPLLLHPSDRVWQETDNRYDLGGMFGWPYETTLAMARFVFSGILEKLPELHIVVHHGGAMIPFFHQRVMSFSVLPKNVQENIDRLKRPPSEYFRRFYADTVLEYNVPALQCAYSYFGADHVLLGTDYPNGGRDGVDFIQQSMDSIRALDCDEGAKNKIMGENAIRLFKL